MKMQMTSLHLLYDGGGNDGTGDGATRETMLSFPTGVFSLSSRFVSFVLGYSENGFRAMRCMHAACKNNNGVRLWCNMQILHGKVIIRDTKTLTRFCPGRLRKTSILPNGEWHFGGGIRFQCWCFPHPFSVVIIELHSQAYDMKIYVAAIGGREKER